MHTMVLGLAGYSLLLSGCIALIFLLKIGCLKDILKTPLHILSTSDTLISVVTSVIILLNQSMPLNNFQQETTMSIKEEISDRQLFSHQEENELRQNKTCMRFSYKYNDSWLASQDINGTEPNCMFRHVLMHYAMFLVPFANAFMSLLIYSMQCNKGISCVNKRCSSLMRMSENSNNDNGQTLANLDSRKKKLQEDSNDISKGPEVDDEAQETVINITEMENITKNANNESKFTGFGLILQWLIPALVTVILYFSQGQDMDKVRELSDMECVLKVNFPLESCYEMESGNVESLIYDEEENYSESSGYFEVNDPDTVMISYPHSEEIDDVVFRVRNVLESVLNKTCNKTIETKYSDNFKPWNITKYVRVTNLTEGIKSNENEILEKLSDIQQALNNKYPEFYKNYECESNNSNDSITTFPEVAEAIDSKVLDDILGNADTVSSKLTPLTTKIEPQDVVHREIISAETLIKSKDTQTRINDSTNEYQDKNQNETAAVYEAAGYENKTTAYKSDTNVEGKFNGQIYAGIIKRIRDTVEQVKVKAQTGNSRDNYEVNRVTFDTGLFHKQFSGNEVKISTLRPEARSISEDRKTVDNFFAKNEGKQMSQTVPVYMDEHCLLSIKFLKVHLLILLFLIYFTPMFISAILQTRAVYACNNILERIDRTEKKNSKASPIPKKTSVSNETLVNKDPLKSGWFVDESGTTNNDVGESSSGLDNLIVIQESNIIPPDRSEAIQSDQKLSFDLRMQKNEETGYKNVKHEVKSMQMLFGILKKSLMLSILMWTPAFLEILSKVFLCSSTPVWLVDILYLLGVSFGIVKNYLNVRIAKMNRNLCDQTFLKENSIRPINGN